MYWAYNNVYFLLYNIYDNITYIKKKFVSELLIVEQFFFVERMNEIL